jgi:hypothetical protein
MSAVAIIEVNEDLSISLTEPELASERACVDVPEGAKIEADEASPKVTDPPDSSSTSENVCFGEPGGENVKADEGSPKGTDPRDSSVQHVDQETTPCNEPVPDRLFSHFYGSTALGESLGLAVCNILHDATSYASTDVRGGYFGRILCAEPDLRKHHCFLNVTEPFSLVCVGRQGSGKSHTLNVVLENCLVSFPEPVGAPITRMRTPMCGLILHYDSCIDNVCEALGLYDMSHFLKDLGSRSFQGGQQVTVLVSPNYCVQRRQFYKRYPNVNLKVKTLQLRWDRLDAAQLKKLMGIDESDNQLYVSDMLCKLGELQRRNKWPRMNTFFDDFEATCSRAQLAPLQQRLNLLRSFVTEGNDHDCAELSSLMTTGSFIICDLTDPMLSETAVNSVFQVLLQQFRRTHVPDCGKVIVFDEAHRYLLPDQKSDSLSKDIVSAVRQMRHENIRVLLSTQSPLDLPHEIIELSTLMVLHEFQSREWYKFIESKLSLPAKGFEIVKKLESGCALLCSNKIMQSLLDVSHGDDERLENSESIIVQVRQRISTDFGGSLTH